MFDFNQIVEMMPDDGITTWTGKTEVAIDFILDAECATDYERGARQAASILFIAMTMEHTPWHIVKECFKALATHYNEEE